MSEDGRILAPTAEEMEKRFKSPPVVVLRPALLGSIKALQIVRRFRWRAVGLEHLRDADGPMIFAANHRSHADTAAILGVLPKQFRHRTAVAAALDVFGPNDKSLIRSLPNRTLQLVVAAGFHAFPFDRLGPPLRSLRTAADMIRNDWSLLLYPEGTRSRKGRLQEFKAGAALLAKSTGRPVVPIHVNGGRTVLPVDSLVPRPGVITVRFGKPMQFEKGESSADFIARLRDTVAMLGVESESEHALAEVDTATDAPPRAEALNATR